MNILTKNIKSTKIIGLALGIIISSSIISSPSFANGNAENGKKLFASSNCNECHGTEIYTSKDRKVKDLSALEAAVRLNDSKLNTNWFDEDVKDVTAYLNQQFYKF